MTTSGSVVKRSVKYFRLDNVHGHIFTPRTYQVELLDVAVQGNTIVCLGTGTGKTFIAVMLIKELAYQVRRPYGEGKCTIFIVDTVATVEQQAQVIEMHTDLSVGAYHEENGGGVDSWSEEKWKVELIKNNVLVMTSKIFLNMILQRFIGLSNINLIVFDECHYAVNDHPYVKIMKLLDVCSSETHPRILGLTASILYSNCHCPSGLERSLNDLELTLHSRAETASDMIMADLYGTKPEEIILECDTYVDTTGLVKEIADMLESALNFILDFRVTVDEAGEKDPQSGAKLVITECLHILKELGPWCVARVAQAFAKQLSKVEDFEEDETVRCFIQMAATLMRMVQKVIDDQFDCQVQTLEGFLLYMSPKVVRLVEILHGYKPDDNFTIIGDDEFSDSGSDDTDDSFEASDEDHSEDDAGGAGSWSKSNSTPKNAKPSSHYVVVRRTSASLSENAEQFDEEGVCGIVFVERKHTAFVLNKLIVELCNWDPDLYFIRSHYITGQGVAAAAREPDSQCQKQEEVLRKFRQRENNLLISTNVLEEGVDVPKCNLVVRFNLPLSYRSYVQSKGRARAATSKYFMLVESNNGQTFKDDLNIFKGIEKVLLSHCRNPDDHSSELINEQETDKLVPAYMPLKVDGAPRVMMTSAIRLVNKYCAKLPSDVFTHLTPKCFVEMTQDGASPLFRARLQLPINSPIKEPIIGIEMPSKRLAQMAAALKTCEILHKSGELDDHLLPVGKELIKYEDEESEWEDHELHGQARPGTTKRKQYYYKKIATSLIGRPHLNVASCLYVLNMTLTCPITEEQNTRGRAIHKPESTSRGFGIICQQRIPVMPRFPVFTRSGEVTVSIDLVTESISLSESQIERLSNFHRFIFSHVLRLEKQPMTYDPDKAKASYIIVPINRDILEENGIDWNFVGLIENSSLIPTRKKFSKDSPKEKFVFDSNVFADAVVMPSYRNIDQPQYFYVAEIRDDLNLRSPFPSPELYDTFEHYYSNKYSLEITNLDQPLLDVDHTSARLNLLTPRYMNQKGVALPTSSAETRRAKRENLQQKQILVPELCDIHPFPASLWRKAVCIPTILYRMNYLLVAEELRVKIASEAYFGLPQMLDNGSFPPLKFDFGEKDGLCTCDGNSGASFAVIKELKEQRVNGTKKWNTIIDENVSQVNEECNYQLMTSESLQFISTSELVVKTEMKSFSAKVERLNGIVSTAHDKDEIFMDVLENKMNIHNLDDVICNERSILHLGNNEFEKEKVQNGLSCSTSSSSVESVYFDCDVGVNPHDININCSKVRINSSDINKDSCNINVNSPCHVGINSCDVDVSSCDDNVECSEHKFICASHSKDVFSLDHNSSYGPSPCDIIQTLTMSNANDFFNLERLETIGDSFLKFAITVYLYCTYPGIHEGKLSYLRSIQVSNYNLYKLGKKKGLPECMVAVKFEPMENWLPPRYVIRSENMHSNLNVQVILPQNGGESAFDPTPDQNDGKSDKANGRWSGDGEGIAGEGGDFLKCAIEQQRQFTQELEECIETDEEPNSSSNKILIPYNLQTQHSLPDKSIADCVEALIGCYLVTFGQRAALLFMAWLGLRVLPAIEKDELVDDAVAAPSNCHQKMKKNIARFCSLQLPPSPLLQHVPNASSVLEFYLNGFDVFEETIQYKFKDRSYLLQAFTHASYHYNTVTDCYQRLEFLGDAILDYVITRHLFEDSTKHSPGILTDLRSALVNNNIFASLAVKWNFHKYFKAVSPQLFSVIEKFVIWQRELSDDILLDEELDCDKRDEDIEIPKALGDIFESVAGAIYLDSGMSLDTVWKVYYRMMKRHIDAFIEKIPKSPVRELLEFEPETAKFEKPVRTIDGKIRVTVNVVGKGSFQGIGRNYRIAKSAAAKWALKHIKSTVYTTPDYSMVYM